MLSEFYSCNFHNIGRIFVSSKFIVRKIESNLHSLSETSCCWPHISASMKMSHFDFLSLASTKKVRIIPVIRSIFLAYQLTLSLQTVIEAMFYFLPKLHNDTV